MNLCIISGSNRPKSESFRVSRFLQQDALVRQLFTDVEIIDLSANAIPLWDGEDMNDRPQFEPWFDLTNILAKSHAFVIVTPEWGGMAPPTLKNLLLMAGQPLLAHKPALILSISAGMGGCNPVHELRANGYKNNHLCFLPDHIIVRQVERHFLHAERDEILPRLHYSLRILHAYSDALVRVRENSWLSPSEFRFGMS